MKGFNGFKGFDGFARAGGLDLPADALFADGFEDGLAAWTNNSGSWAIDTALAKRGSQSVSVDIQDTSIHDITVDLGSNYDEVYFSFYLKLGSGFVIGDNEQFSFVVFYSQNAAAAIGQIDLNKTGIGTYRIRFLRYGGTLFSADIESPESDWIWVKVRYNGTASGTIEYYVNGVMVASESGSYVNKFGQFRARVQNVDAGTSGKIYIDNVVISENDHGEPPY